MPRFWKAWVSSHPYEVVVPPVRPAGIDKGSNLIPPVKLAGIKIKTRVVELKGMT